ncbi:MAG: peptidoglycan-associated lipoprotein Pal [Gammaproteobacteria bacterium]
MKIEMKIFALLASALLLTACGGSESVTKSDETVATVEDRSIGEGEGEDGTESHGAMDSAGLDATDLNNPDSPLSIRVIYFEYDSATVLADYRPAVEAHASYLADHPDTYITLEGHADERGSREYNLALGENRAESLKQQMVLMGASPDQIVTVSYGEERPAEDGHDDEAYSLNRRAELVY